MPVELQAHLRYPEDLFTAQNEMYRLYHLPATDNGATTFYNEDDRWAIPVDQVTGTGQPIEPYYVMMRIPGEEEAEFVLIQPMVPERSEEHTSELQSLMRISYAVFCLKKKKTT